MCQPTTNDLEKGRRESDQRPKFGGGKAPKRGVYMDEALSEAKFGKFNYFLIIISGIILFSVIMELCGIGYILPVCSCELELTPNQKGILASVAFFGIICSSHLWGFLADTQGRRCVIQPTLLLTFLFSVASSFTSNFYILALLRFCNGFFISGSSATIYAYLSEFHDNKHRSRVIMTTALMFGISLPLLPLMAFAVINQEWQLDIPILEITYKPWRLFLIVASLPALFTSIALLFIPESPKFLLGQGKHDEAIQVVQKLNRWNNGKNAVLNFDEIYEEAESIENRRRILDCKQSRFPLLTSVWNQTAPLFQRPYLGSMLLICLIQFCIFYTSTGVFIFFTEIVNRMANSLEDFTTTRVQMCDVLREDHTATGRNETLRMAAPSAGCVTKLEPEAIEMGIILETLYAVGFAIISLLINKVGKFPILFVILVGGGLSAIACVLIDIPIVQIGLLILFLCTGITGNVVNLSTVDLFPTALRAMAVCISLMFGRLGGVVGSNITALLLDSHCELAFYVPAASLIVCAILTYFIPKIHEKSTKPTPAEHRISINSMRG